VTGSLTLHDVSRDGRVLVSHDTNQVGIVARGPGAAQDRDLSWLDWSLVSDISEDGRFVLFTETGEGGGAGYSVYLRNLDGSPAVRLGEGNGQALSADGKRAIALVGPPGAAEIAIYPTGAGEPRKVPFHGGIVRTVRWLPDGRLLLAARDSTNQSRIFVLDADSGKARPLSSGGFRGSLQVSPDGKHFVCIGPDGFRYLASIDGGEPTKIAAIDAADTVMDWAADGRLYVVKGTASEVPMRVYTVDPLTGKKGDWRDLAPANSTGLNALNALRLASNGAYAYSYFRALSDLFLVEGIR
jgi:Tol biopolymer transport system component